MANIINQQYFVRETNIGGVEQPEIYQTVCAFVAEYEPKMLVKAMGYDLYKLFAAAIYVNTPPTSGRYYDIVAGAEYSVNGVTKRWDGLKTANPNASIIAKYVYYYYMRNNMTQTAITGEVKPANENSTIASYGYKMAKNWNDMIDQVKILWEFLLNKKDDSDVLVYPEFTMSKADCKHFRKINTFGI